MSRSVDDFVRQILARLIPNGPRPLSLDEIGDAIDGEAVGPEEIELLLDRLQEAGVEIIDDEGEGLVVLLRQVILTAHQLRGEGKKATLATIAERSGMSERAVRVALLYADVLKG